MKVGLTKVSVKRKDEKQIAREIHRGVIVQLGTSFARVYKANSRDESGDVNHTTTEWFPIAGKYCWIEEVGTLKEPIFIAPELR